MKSKRRYYIPLIGLLEYFDDFIEARELGKIPDKNSTSFVEIYQLAVAISLTVLTAFITAKLESL